VSMERSVGLETVPGHCQATILYPIALNSVQYVTKKSQAREWTRPSDQPPMRAAKRCSSPGALVSSLRGSHALAVAAGGHRAPESALVGLAHGKCEGLCVLAILDHR